MELEQKPFTRYNLDEDRGSKDVFTIRLTPDDRKMLDACKPVLNQSKDGTALKQLARIGAKVLHDNKMKDILEIIYANKRKNKRSGIIEYDD